MAGIVHSSDLISSDDPYLDEFLSIVADRHGSD
jgi:hypothetical protein